MNNVLLGLLTEKVRRLDERMVEAHYLGADARVRRRLLELGAIYGGADGETVIPLTQEEIAAMAGTSRATVNRVLREEEKRGTLQLRRGKTLLVAPDELARRARSYT